MGTRAITAVGIMLYKKGDRSQLGNCRCIWLLAIVGRIMAKIISTRLRLHCECNNLLQEVQWGFRQYRSTMGPIFILRVLLKILAEADHPKMKTPADWDIVLGMADIRKAYPRVVRTGMQKVMERAGLPPKFTKVAK